MDKEAVGKIEAALVERYMQCNGWEFPSGNMDCEDYDAAVKDVKWFMHNLEQLGYRKPHSPELREKMAQKIYGYVLKNIEPFAVIVPMPWEKLTLEAKDYWQSEVAQMLQDLDNLGYRKPLDPFENKGEIESKEEAKKQEGEVILVQLVERLGFEISEGHITDSVGKSVGKANFEDFMRLVEHLLREARREEKERIISQIEAMDKRHSISFVLQALKEGEK